MNLRSIRIATTSWAISNEALSRVSLSLPDTGELPHPRWMKRPYGRPSGSLTRARGYLPQQLVVWSILRTPPRLAHDTGMAGKRDEKRSGECREVRKALATTRKRKADYCPERIA